MRIGMFARADNGGLGQETWEFARHMNPDKVLVIRGEHGHYPERYQGLNVLNVDGIPKHEELDHFLRDIDVLFSIESYYNWGAITMARLRGIKTILRVNYEMDLGQMTPEFVHPDLYISPSKWHYEDIPDPKTYIPYPVNREVCQYKNRNKVNSFYHIAGHLLHEDRNGTQVFLEALRWMKTKPPIKIYTQHDLGVDLSTYSNVELVNEVENYWDIHTGDCLILPRRYGGQSLQVQEALSCGIPVIMPSVSPQNEFLPQQMMFDAKSSRIIEVQGGHVECAEIDPQILAKKIDEVYNSDISKMSSWANDYAQTISWEELKPKYIKIMEDLCK